MCLQQLLIRLLAEIGDWALGCHLLNAIDIYPANGWLSQSKYKQRVWPLLSSLQVSGHCLMDL